MADEEDFNAFSNDGSFMESFMKKMQEEKKPESKPTDSKLKQQPPLMGRKPLLKTSKFKKVPVLTKGKGGVLVGKVSSTNKKKKVEEESAPSDQQRKTEEEIAPSNQGKEVGGETSNDLKKAVEEGTTNNQQKREEDTAPKELDIPPVTSVGVASSGVGSIIHDPSTSTAGQAQGLSTSQLTGRKRRRNRWSDAPPSSTINPPTSSGGSISTADSAIPQAIVCSPVAPITGQQQLPQQQHGLTTEQLQQIKEQIEMNKLVAEIRTSMEHSVQTKKQKDPNQPVYEYDSDEDVEGGTWEHKKRAVEMLTTEEKAMALTEMNKGKHHIGDFLPPQELEKFIEKAEAIKEGRPPDMSDYKEHKLDDSNVGFKLLQKAGWLEGQGLGEKEDGIVEPINQGKTLFDQAGVGSEVPGEVTKDDSAFDTYRKRMMLAYRFRPNPLNNPRRPYY